MGAVVLAVGVDVAVVLAVGVAVVLAVAVVVAVVLGVAVGVGLVPPRTGDSRVLKGEEDGGALYQG